jgi:hypothetical protein
MRRLLQQHGRRLENVSISFNIILVDNSGSHTITIASQSRTVYVLLRAGLLPFFQIPRKLLLMAQIQKSTDSSSLAEVIDRILDKGIVIDAFVKVSLVGIELISIEARIVIASVETYLKYAEAIGLTASAAAPA